MHTQKKTIIDLDIYQKLILNLTLKAPVKTVADHIWKYIYLSEKIKLSISRQTVHMADDVASDNVLFFSTKIHVC